MPVYVYKNNQKLGPFAESVVAERIREGQYSPDDLGWREGMTEWQPLRTIITPDDDDPEVFRARVDAAAANVREKRERHQRIIQALDKMKAYYEDRYKIGEHTYHNDKVLRDGKYKKLVFEWDDLKVVEELTRILKIGDSQVVVIQEGAQFEVYYLANESKCFIATATYGSPLTPEVMMLRDFRDNVLLHSSIGSLFVKFYYRISPPFALIIAKNSRLRAIVRRTVLTPILRLLKAASEIEH